jgi:hypothetical protein
MDLTGIGLVSMLPGFDFIEVIGFVYDSFGGWDSTVSHQVRRGVHRRDAESAELNLTQRCLGPRVLTPGSARGVARPVKTRKHERGDIYEDFIAERASCLAAQ